MNKEVIIIKTERIQVPIHKRFIKRLHSPGFVSGNKEITAPKYKKQRILRYRLTNFEGEKEEHNIVVEDKNIRRLLDINISERRHWIRQKEHYINVISKLNNMSIFQFIKNKIFKNNKE